MYSFITHKRHKLKNAILTNTNLYIDNETSELATGEFLLANGSIAHISAGVIHRDPKDGPAMIDIMGAKYFIVHGRHDRIVFPWQLDPEPTKYNIVVKN